MSAVEKLSVRPHPQDLDLPLPDPRKDPGQGPKTQCRLLCGWLWALVVQKVKNPPAMQQTQVQV